MVFIHVSFNVILQEHLDLPVHLRTDIFDKEASNDTGTSKAHQSQ